MRGLNRRGFLKVGTTGAFAAAMGMGLGAPPSVANADSQSDGLLDLASRRELFLDRVLIDRLENATLRLQEPMSGGTAIGLDRPWEGPANCGYAVLRRGRQFLMYYRAMTVEKGDDSGVLCVATSEDGATWTKPSLGLVERAGRKDTNVVVDETGQPLLVTPWLDTRPGVPEDERIKAFASQTLSGEKNTPYKDPKGAKHLVFWSSADGFTFRKLARQPEIISSLPNCFDGGNSLFWSEAEQQYVLYYRWYDKVEGVGRRTVARTVSTDFYQWTEAVPMTYGDAPREQFYLSNTDPYFRAPHIYIAVAARFMEGRRAVTDEQAQAIGLKTAQGHSYNNDCSDAVLLTSRAGSSQYDRTFMETFVRPGLGASNWVSRTNYPLTGVYPFDEGRIMFFVARHYMQDSWHIERMLLRTDGFAAVSAPWSGGELVTKPFRFAGRELEINYRTGAPGSLRVELQDGAGKPLPGHALADCPEILGDEIARVVRWESGSDLGAFVGQPVRLRFALRDADLFALKFNE